MNDTSPLPHWSALLTVRRATVAYRATLLRYRHAIEGLAILDDRAGELADAIGGALDEPPAWGTVAHLHRVVREIDPPAEIGR